MEPIAEVVQQQFTRLESMRNATEPCVQPETECLECKGVGYVVERGAAHPCRCTIERRIRAILPERFHRASLRDFQGERLETAEAWLRNPTNGLFIPGEPGTGKTYLAAAIVRALVESRRQVQFRRAAQFFFEIRQAFHNNSSESLILDPLTSVRVLVLDDLGAGSLSDFERRSTLELLDCRWNALRPTIVTSNWTLQKISDLMDDRIASRLASFTTLKLVGEDWRVRCAS